MAAAYRITRKGDAVALAKRSAKVRPVINRWEGMDMQTPKVTAADLKAAATRLLGTVIHDIAGVVSGPAVYVPRLEAFAAIEDTTAVLADDDGSVIDVLNGVPAREVIALHGTAGRAAAAVNAELRRTWSA
jgi:hypothetical protein